MTDRDRRLAPAPTPRRLAHLCDQIVKTLADAGDGLSIADEFAWLYPSGYHRSRAETGERTRREVGGASGDLSDGFAGLETVRRHLSEAAQDIVQALDLVRGARAAMRRCQSAADGSSRHLADGVAEDPMGPAVPRDEWRNELGRLRDAQRRRIERGRNRPTPWSGEEATG